LNKLLEYPDRRIKAIVYVMSSSGIRLGAWDYLNWGHIIPIKRDNQIVAAKIKVYAGEEGEEYFSFITAETAMTALPLILMQLFDIVICYCKCHGDINNNHASIKEQC
jgi:hypothetical protein